MFEEYQNYKKPIIKSINPSITIAYYKAIGDNLEDFIAINNINIENNTELCISTFKDIVIVFNSLISNKESNKKKIKNKRKIK